MKRIKAKYGQIVFCTVLIFSFLSCQKNNVTEQKSENKIDNSVIGHLIKWMNTQKENSSINEQRHIDSLLLLADWDNGDIEKVSSSKSIIYVSLKNSVTGLAFFYDTNNKSIDSSNLIYIKAANNSFLNKPIKAVVSYYVTEILKRDYALGFSGTFASYTLRNKYQHEYGFKDGVILWRKFMAPKSRTDLTTKKSNTSKKDYFECEWWGNFTRWADGSITLNYVYQVCYECQTTSIGITTGGQYIKNQCGGGGR